MSDDIRSGRKFWIVIKMEDEPDTTIFEKICALAVKGTKTARLIYCELVANTILTSLKQGVSIDEVNETAFKECKLFTGLPQSEIDEYLSYFLSTMNNSFESILDWTDKIKDCEITKVYTGYNPWVVSVLFRRL